MKDKLKTLRHQIESNLKGLEDILLSDIQLELSELDVIHGKIYSLKWVLNCMEENASGQTQTTETSRSTQEAVPTSN